MFLGERRAASPFVAFTEEFIVNLLSCRRIRGTASLYQSKYICNIAGSSCVSKTALEPLGTMGIICWQRESANSISAMSEATSRKGVVSYGTRQPDGEERSDELEAVILKRD